MACNNCNCTTTTATTGITQDVLCASSVVVRPCDRAGEIMNNQVLENIRSYLCNITLSELECEAVSNCLSSEPLDCTYFTGTGVDPVHS